MIKTSKNRSPLKILKKRRQALYEIPNPRGSVEKVLFKFNPLLVVFSNNISIPQVRVNKKETELDLTLKLLNHYYQG